LNTTEETETFQIDRRMVFSGEMEWKQNQQVIADSKKTSYNYTQ